VKGTTTERGYGYPHRKERARLALLVAAGQAYCQQGRHGSSGRCIYPSRWIAPGSRWALGHNDARTGWIGTVHAACNQLDGASRGGKTIAARRGRRSHGIWRSERW
jgi:hypothetical protein